MPASGDMQGAVHAGQKVAQMLTCWRCPHGTALIPQCHCGQAEFQAKGKPYSRRLLRAFQPAVKEFD
jgi:hypothetical protein